MILSILRNVHGGWVVIRSQPNSYGGEDRMLLGEIKYLDPDGPDLDVTFTSRSELFKGYPEDLKIIESFMARLMVDSST